MLSTERVEPSRVKALLVCIFLGFSSGLPLFILYNLLSAWLKSEGVDLKAIGLFALVGIPYTWKDDSPYRSSKGEVIPKTSQAKF